MANVAREAMAYFAAMAAKNRRLGLAHHASFHRPPPHQKPSAPKPADKRAKVKAARKQRRNNRG